MLVTALSVHVSDAQQTILSHMRKTSDTDRVWNYIRMENTALHSRYFDNYLQESCR